MSSTNPVAIVLNAASGDASAEKARERIEELFAAAGRSVEITLARNGDELKLAIDAAIARGASALVGGGGDGTISRVASALVGTDIPLGVVPLGTLNHFAKDLGIPLELDQAIAVVLVGHTSRVDVGEINGRHFLNNSSLGLYPRVVRLRQQHPVRGFRKWLVAVWALIKTLERNPVMSVSIEAEGEKVTTRTPIVFIGNNEYKMSGFDAGTRESLTGARLAVYIVKSGGRPRLMRFAWRLFTGQALRSGELDLLLVETATVSVHGSQAPVALDGEVVSLETPLEFRIRPAALSVLVAKPPTGDDRAFLG